MKLSGDRAPFYHSTSFILLSFSFPSIDHISSSATGKTKFVNITVILKTFQCTCTCIIGTHTVGVLEGAEHYEAIKNGFSPLLAEINTIINKGVIPVSDQLYPLTFVIGGVQGNFNTNRHHYNVPITVSADGLRIKCCSLKVCMLILPHHKR